MSEVLELYKAIDEYEEELFFKNRNTDLDERDEILVSEAIDQNLPIIIKNVDLFTKKKKVKKYLEDLYELDHAVESMQKIIHKVREDVELNIFFKDGKTFDLTELDLLYKTRNIKKVFPKFNFKKWKELLKTPILEIKNYNGDIIYYDPLIVRKIMIAINQMVFNEMDIYQIVCGKEGSGKSCFSSALLLYYYTILNEADLIEYAYDVTKLFFSSVLALLDETTSLKNNDFFRIITLDEANELNRLNFKDDQVKEFKQDMRVSRKQLKIMTINIQQLGELDLSISLSRVNFIFDCLINNDSKTGTLKKGKIDFYIIPRGDKIFSEFHKKEFSRIEIINAFSEKLEKKKDYYISLPKSYLIHQFKFNGVWGFNKSEYDEYIKNENKKRAIGKELKLSSAVAYGFLRKIFNVLKYKELGTFDLKKKGDVTLYKLVTKFIERMKTYFKLNPEIERNFDRIYDQVDEKHQEADINAQIELKEELEDLVPDKYKEEVDFLPDLKTEKPKTFYKDANK